jgi:peptide/nickel transport system substrate-binding protein
VGWKRVGGQAGLELVPDLAVSLPSVSEDRRTYTFQLRSGIHYSDGRLVKPSDVRYSFERLWTVLPRLRELNPDEDPNIGGAYFSSIVGTDGCNARPAQCELTRGIVTDDGAGTVSFRLTAPDPDFLFKLALPFALVLPKGTSPREPAERPLPATGPYVVASAVKGSTRLVRNPRFREWSSAAQPAGFPDEIVVNTAPEVPGQRVRLVIDGKADLTSVGSGQPLSVPLTHRSQLHVQRQPTAFYLVLNVTGEPFDDVRARRAVNYALDRAKVVGFAGGADVATPSCQVLPPNFPGHKQYCPYTVDSNGASGWTAPDVAKARDLIGESGTQGADVAVWWHQEFGEEAGRYIEQLLDSLGYRARLRLFSGDVGDYFAAVQAPGASWQVAGAGWLADYPAASQFIQLLSCSFPFNLGHFCDRAIDAKINRALELQERDPAAANESWAALDRELTDQAPWVTLYSFNSADFVSKRVGNYQYHLISGALLGQLWVR